MKKIVLLIMIVTLGCPGILPAASGDNCCRTIDEIMDKAAKEFREMSITVMKEYIKEPETVNIEDCLSMINSISLGFSFSLPSLDQLLVVACDFAKGQIESKLDEITSKIESKYSFEAYGFGVGAEFELGTDGKSNIDVDFEVHDISGEIVDSIWSSIQ